MRKGRDGEEQNNKTKENNDGNSGPLTSLPVGLPKSTDCNDEARANWSYGVLQLLLINIP